MWMSLDVVVFPFIHISLFNRLIKSKQLYSISVRPNIHYTVQIWTLTDDKTCSQATSWLSLQLGQEYCLVEK